ncbi:hypothetical protein [Oricola indica]|uniref:hypothetical protein n=1 Tax=Oricola indica TaxID=2872591 RepID=UPI003CCC26B1
MKHDRQPLLRLRNSKVIDSKGQPLLVFRGEHGPIVKERIFHTRLGSISFGSKSAAKLYSNIPNYRSDIVSHSRVISSYLSINNPVVNRPFDPFVDFTEIIAAIGFDKSKEIALRLSCYIENTNNWTDKIQYGHESVVEFINSIDDALEHLYVDAYAIFDEAEFVKWFSDVGFDGAIHGGSGMTAGEPEYKIFSSSQALSCKII